MFLRSIKAETILLIKDAAIHADLNLHVKEHIKKSLLNAIFDACL